MSNQIQKISNPQGKGVAGVMQDLRAFSPMHVQAKTKLQWLADYFTSTLVLGAKYGFKPVVGKEYYLYFKNQDWKLSLIEPHAWRSHNPGIYFAECILSNDMSWSVVLDPNWQGHAPLVKAIQLLEQAFFKSINDATPLVNKLPFYMEDLSYYQRLGANALARSLKKSLEIEMGEKCLAYTGAVLLAQIEKKEIYLLEYFSSNRVS